MSLATRNSLRIPVETGIPFRRRLLAPALALLIALGMYGTAHAKGKQTEFYGELEPRLYTAPELMRVTAFKPISLAEAKQLGVVADAGDRIYSGEFSLVNGEKVHRAYPAIIIRLPAGNHALYVDANLNGRFDPDERTSFLPVTNPEFPRFNEMASFDVDLPGGGMFRTCPMEVAVAGEPGKAAEKGAEIAVEYTATAFVRGFAALSGQQLLVRFEYDFDMGGISLRTGREYIDLNQDGKIDMSPGSPECLQAKGSAPVFRTGALTLQLKSVDLRRDQFVLQTVGPRPSHWHFPFQK